MPSRPSLTRKFRYCGMMPQKNSTLASTTVHVAAVVIDSPGPQRAWRAPADHQRLCGVYLPYNPSEQAQARQLMVDPRLNARRGARAM